MFEFTLKLKPESGFSVIIWALDMSFILLLIINNIMGSDFVDLIISSISKLLGLSIFKLI